VFLHVYQTQIRSRLHKEVEIAEEKRSLPLNKIDTQGKAHHPNYQSPVMPNWNCVRPNMNLDFITHHSGPAPFAAPLGKKKPGLNLEILDCA
jgi:hypothetical protein